MLKSFKEQKCKTRLESLIFHIQGLIETVDLEWKLYVHGGLKTKKLEGV